MRDTNNNDDIQKISKELKKIKGLAKLVSEITPLKDITPFTEKLRCLAYASKDRLIKSKNNCTRRINFLDKKNYVFTIGSTIVVILNKDHEHDKETLLNRIRTEIISKHNSYLIMLGLEMKNQLSKNHSFITGDVLNIKNDTIAFHWNQNIQHGNEILYQDFIKQIMVDQTDTTLKSNSFKLLNSNLLNAKKIRRKQNIKQLAQINSFYNGTFINVKDRLVSFGDIFQNENNDIDFYLCITALCDCLYPDNIKNNYYFVQGKKFSVDTALDLGDEAFVSYIDDETSIIWLNFGPDTTLDKYKPVYIKPLQFHIPNPYLTDFKLESLQFENGEKEILKWKYIFTLRNQYSQRISNHSFSYPLRVGIDFVKKK